MINFNKKDSVAEEVTKILAQEAELSHKQKRIAALAGDKKAIDALDLAALRAGKKPVDVEEGFGEMDKYLKDKEKEKGTGKYDKKKISTGTVYQKKHNAPKEDEKDDMKEEVEELDEISTKLLAKSAHAASDPDSDYAYGKSHDAQKFADHAKKTKDAKSAAAVQGAADAKGHYPRDNHTYGSYDKLASRNSRSDNPNMVTKAGKLTKTAVKGLKSSMKEDVEQIDEAVSRKHFQQVADLIKSHENAEKRKELAQHHASIFKTQNPRFDHAKFMKAAGVNEGSWAEEVDTDVRTQDMLKGPKSTKQKDDVGPGSDGKSTKVRYHAGPHPSNEEVELDERTLTAAETKKKEHMVMSMKPKLKDFKRRYGERAKEVLYATATKRAKGE
jgi:hypothetical protein